MAKKVKTTYVCQSCGYQSPKWAGKCASCNEWNSFVEELDTSNTVSSRGNWHVGNEKIKVSEPIPLHQVDIRTEQRKNTGDLELDRTLGGGIVNGSLVLIGGEPGIGKSTLLLQLALRLQKAKVIYVSGEESAQQIRMRAERIGIENEHCYILSETNTQNIFVQLKKIQPDIVIIDSIQTIHSSVLESASGSVSQIKECTSEFMKYAKETQVPVFLVGHITKDGHLAGPKILEHMVDTVLQFEGERNLNYRILRSIKNRFGSTSELGIYEMRGNGLKEVNNPSEVLLSQREDNLSGIATGTTLEGNRSLMIEVQSLVSPSAYGTPQRSTTGFDAKRLNMLLAVLDKRVGYKLGHYDVFLNIAGGIKVEDPSIDLAVCASLISSYEDRPISKTTAFIAEVGLGGEVRATNRLEQRIGEAEKLGFTDVIVSKYGMKGFEKGKFDIQIQEISLITDLKNFI